MKDTYSLTAYDNDCARKYGHNRPESKYNYDSPEFVQWWVKNADEIFNENNVEHVKMYQAWEYNQ